MTIFESWMLAVTIVALVVSSGLSIWAVLFSVRRGDIEMMKKELGDKAGELVDAKFQTLAAEMESPIAVLTSIVNEMKSRLNWGDNKFETDGERLHKVELQCREASQQTRGWALEHFATHGQLAGVANELQNMRSALIRCEEKCSHLEGRGK